MNAERFPVGATSIGMNKNPSTRDIKTAIVCRWLRKSPIDIRINKNLLGVVRATFVYNLLCEICLVGRSGFESPRSFQGHLEQWYFQLGAETNMMVSQKIGGSCKLLTLARTCGGTWNKYPCFRVERWMFWCGVCLLVNSGWCTLYALVQKNFRAPLYYLSGDGLNRFWNYIRLTQPHYSRQSRI